MARTAVEPRSGSTSADAVFDAWFERHGDELRSFSTRLTGNPAVAEDVVQETFARAWSHIDQLREREEVGPWLYRVARNLCVDSHRARRRLVSSDTLPGRVEEGDRPEAADPLRHVELEEERQLVREALASLTDRHRDVLFLRDIEGMAYDDLGRRHGLSADSARAVLARARRRLRDELKTMGNGVFGLGLWVRFRLDGAFRRAGGGRVPMEPLIAAVAQYLVVAAAAVGLALGPPSVAAGGNDAPAPDTSLEGAVLSETDSPAGSDHVGNQTSRGSTGGAGPEGAPRSPKVTLDAGPDQGLPANPVNPNGSGNWVEGTLLSIHTENAPGGTEPVVRPVASTVCDAQGSLCAPPDN